MFVSSSFVPSMRQIAEDIGTTGHVISLAVSISLLGSTLGSMLFATYSTFCAPSSIFTFIHLLTNGRRWAETCPFSRNAHPVFRVVWGGTSSEHIAVNALSVSSSAGWFQWVFLGVWSYWRHLQIRRERHSDGYFFRCKQF